MLTTAPRSSPSKSLRWITVALGLAVAAYMPAMQMIVDHRIPRATKPVLAGLLLGVLIASCSLLPRRWNVKLFLLSTMGVMTLGLAEVACSLLLSPVSSSIYDWDDRCIYRTRPNSRKLYRRLAINGGQTSEVVINSQGFRGPEVTEGSGNPRVLLYGDSFIEAEYSEWENTFGEQLRQATSQLIGDPIEVNNAGTNGYGPDQQLLRMEAELPRLRPDVVILAVFADNDYGDLLRNKLFRLDEQGELIPNRWSRAPDCLHPGLRGPYEPTLWKLARNAVRGVQSQGGVVESYMERWRLQCLAEYDEYVTRRDPQVHDLQADHYDADIALTPGVSSAQYKATLFAKILGRIAAECRKVDAKLLVVVIPSPADLIDNYDFCQIDQRRYPDYDKHALTGVAVTSCRELKLECVNLSDTFARTGADQLYFRGGDNHWNDAGQQVAAGVVAPVLTELLRKSRPLESP